MLQSTMLIFCNYWDYVVFKSEYDSYFERCIMSRTFSWHWLIGHPGWIR